MQAVSDKKINKTNSNALGPDEQVISKNDQNTLELDDLFDMSLFSSTKTSQSNKILKGVVRNVSLHSNTTQRENNADSALKGTVNLSEKEIEDVFEASFFSPSKNNVPNLNNTHKKTDPTTTLNSIVTQRKKHIRSAPESPLRLNSTNSAAGKLGNTLDFKSQLSLTQMISLVNKDDTDIHSSSQKENIPHTSNKEIIDLDETQLFYHSFANLKTQNKPEIDCRISSGQDNMKKSQGVRSTNFTKKISPNQVTNANESTNTQMLSLVNKDDSDVHSSPQKKNVAYKSQTDKDIIELDETQLFDYSFANLKTQTKAEIDYQKSSGKDSMKKSQGGWSTSVTKKISPNWVTNANESTKSILNSTNSDDEFEPKQSRLSWIKPKTMMKTNQKRKKCHSPIKTRKKKVCKIFCYY